MAGGRRGRRTGRTRRGTRRGPDPSSAATRPPGCVRGESEGGEDDGSQAAPRRQSLEPSEWLAASGRSRACVVCARFHRWVKASGVAVGARCPTMLEPRSPDARSDSSRPRAPVTSSISSASLRPATAGWHSTISRSTSSGCSCRRMSHSLPSVSILTIVLDAPRGKSESASSSVTTKTGCSPTRRLVLIREWAHEVASS